MKAILEFTLPEDDIAHKQCVKASDMAMVIWEFVNNSKKGIGWRLDDLGEIGRYEVLDMVFERFIELLNEYKVDPDELVV